MSSTAAPASAASPGSAANRSSVRMSSPARRAASSRPRARRRLASTSAFVSPGGIARPRTGCVVVTREGPRQPRAGGVRPRSRASLPPTLPLQYNRDGSFIPPPELLVSESDAPDFAGLVALAAQGHPAALDELTRRYEPKIRLVARVVLGPA